MKKSVGQQLILHNSSIQVWVDTIYLSVQLAKDSFGDNTYEIKVKCIPAVTLIKPLFHLSQRADRKMFK